MIVRTVARMIPPNPDAMAISRLYLERLPLMTDEERGVFLGIVKILATPPMIVSSEPEATAS